MWNAQQITASLKGSLWMLTGSLDNNIVSGEVVKAANAFGMFFSFLEWPPELQHAGPLFT
jgi:hypothetical protein